MELDLIYYFITFFCTAGGCYTGFYKGRRDGVESFISFLESRTNRKNEVKLRISKNDVEFLNVPD